MFGERETDEFTSMVCGEPVFRIDELRNPPIRDKRCAKSALKAMSERAVFRFVLDAINVDRDLDFWGAYTGANPATFRDD